MWNQGGGFGGGGGAGNGFDQGGGFMNSQSFGGASQKASSSGKRAQYIVPCTIATIHNAVSQDDKFYIDGKYELPQLTLVGMVRQVKETGTRIEYVLDDFTGPPIDVRIFVDAEEDRPDGKAPTVYRENSYIRIYGHLRSFQEKRNVVAFKILPIEDMNELTMHLLEVMKTHITFAKGDASSGAGTTSMYEGAVGGGYGGGAGYQGGDAGGATYGNGMEQGLNRVQNQILNVIRNAMTEEGVSITHIRQSVSNLPDHQIRDAVEFLSGEGHIYSTIDDDHFRSTDSM